MTLLTRMTALLLVTSVCAIIPTQAASAKSSPRQITQVKAEAVPASTSTTVAVSVRVKNTSDKRRGAAHAQVFLVGDTRVFGLGKVKVPGIRANRQATASMKQKAPAAAPAGRYAVRVCLVAYPDECRTSGRTVQIAPAHLTASPTALSFGDTLEGTSSPAKQVRITNTGPSRTGTLLASVASTSFKLDSSTCRAPLSPGASCTVAVAFTPRADGAVTGSLQVADSAGARVTAALAGTGTEPAALSIAPDDLLFATTTIGDSTDSQTVTVTNEGDYPSGTPTVGLSGEDDDQFDITANTCDTALPAGGTCTVDIAYSPTTPGAAAAVLTAGATPGGEVTADLTGGGQTPPALAISDESHDYGYTDAPAEHVFTVTNTGDAATGVPSASIDGSPAFTVTTNTCTAVLPGDATCSVGVTYTGSGATEQSAQLEVTATGGGTVSAALTGSPVALSISPASHDFGDVEVSTASDETTVVVTNHRSTPLDLVESTSGPFSADDGCDAATVPGGETCTFTATFSPTDAGPASGYIAYGAGSDTAQVELSGNGTTPAALTVTPSVADFGAWAVGGAPGTSDVTITNTGTTSTDTVSVTVGGADTDDFSVDASGCPDVLTGGASCTATLTFAPVDFGDKTATLSVDGAPGNTVDLVGLGAPAGVSLFAAAHDYGQVDVGGAAYYTFRVVNTTENGEDMNSASSGPPFPLELNQDFTCVLVISTIQPHRWCTMSLSFKPQSVGSFSTTLTAGGTNFNTSSQLLGTGVPSAVRSRGGSSQPVGPYTVEIKDGKPVTR